MNVFTPTETEFITIPKGKMSIVLNRMFDGSNAMIGHSGCHYIIDGGLVAIVNKQTCTEKLIRRALQHIRGLPPLKWTWHKEDWYMGHGFWLQSEIAGRIYHPYKNDEVEYWYELKFNWASNAIRLHPFYKYLGDLDGAAGVVKNSLTTGRG